MLHVTGTNGKTSVARIASALLTAGGCPPARYTSPHLERVNERMSLGRRADRRRHPAARLEQVAVIEPHLPDVPSYFEILTGAALTWFADVAVEAAVVEVGLGGTWDATNVVDSAVAVVTNVSIDHVEYLHDPGSDRGRQSGDREAGATWCSARPTPSCVPSSPAREPGGSCAGPTSASTRNDRDWRAAHRPVHARAALPRGVRALHGAHQADNAAIAFAAVEALLDAELPEDLVTEVLRRCRSPGRLEVVGHHHSCARRRAQPCRRGRAHRRARRRFAAADRTLVVGLLREKDPHEMLEALGVTRPRPPRVLRAAEPARA